MRMHDRGHVWAMAIDPQMEAVRWIHHSVAFQEIEIVVDQNDVDGARLVKAEAEAQHPVGAMAVTARGDLAGKRGLVALGRKNPAGERDPLAERPGRHG